MPSNCSKAWVCANISRPSARMASVPWWSGFAPTLVPRFLQPLSGAARTSVLRPLGQLSGSLHGPRNDWPAPERQRPYQILKAPADGAGRPGNNLCLRIARGLSWNNPGRLQLTDLAERCERQGKELELQKSIRAGV